MNPGMFGLIPGLANLTGWILVVILIVMAICSHPSVRRSGSFEVNTPKQFITKMSIVSDCSKFLILGVLLDTFALHSLLGHGHFAWAKFLEMVRPTRSSFFRNRVAA